MLGERLWGMWRPPAGMNIFARWWQQCGYYLAVALFNVFPLPQQSGVRESFAYAGESVDRGYSVLVYPEGIRTPDGKACPFRSGIGMLAARLNIPVVGSWHTNLHEYASRRLLTNLDSLGDNTRASIAAAVERHALAARARKLRRHQQCRKVDVRQVADRQRPISNETE